MIALQAYHFLVCLSFFFFAPFFVGEVKDFVLSKIAKRGGKPLAPGEPMFIDAQESRAGPILEL